MGSAFTLRLAVDIGGTFTDVALAAQAGTDVALAAQAGTEMALAAQAGTEMALAAQAGTEMALAAPMGVVTAKVLTTPQAPERGVMDAVQTAAGKAGCSVAQVGLIIHGTTLATNALIERKGACTALITTEGFRDSVEIGYEHRFEQYDVQLEKPQPLVPRRRRYAVPERIGARGQLLRPLDERAVRALLPALERDQVESVAVGLLHSYANPAHERRIRDILREAAPRLAVSLSSEVSPELREYERLSTTCANAYVQPLMAGYLDRLDRALREAGFGGQLLLMTSGGGVIGLDSARRFPIRLVESGPAGGAILASRVAAQCKLDHVLSFDMGGTTAKICLIDGGEPDRSRSFEVARAYRFLKGSGLPLRVPVVEMVEIGAGGGSIARIDALQRMTVGPDSTGAAPGPACYGRGGREASVTDADLVLGRIDPDAFAGGGFGLVPSAARAAIEHSVGAPLALDARFAALAIAETVDENMASAARVHAVERGKRLDERTLVAFGGAAPLHATRLADKLGIRRVVVPAGAGVGSAVGMLAAPVAYEVARSLYQRVSQLDHAAVNALLDAMRAEARAVVEGSARGVELVESRTVYMRYVGQGHEIAVPLEARALEPADRQRLQQAFEREYRLQFGRVIPGLDAEVLGWALSVCAPVAPPGDGATSAESATAHGAGGTTAPPLVAHRRVLDPASGIEHDAQVYRREQLAPGHRIRGPALIVEDATTTVVAPGFEAWTDAFAHLILERQEMASQGNVDE